MIYELRQGVAAKVSEWLIVHSLTLAARGGAATAI
jgi:hypothetical protein